MRKIQFLFIKIECIGIVIEERILTDFETKYPPFLLNITNGYDCICNNRELEI